MRVLIDECLPRELKRFLAEHDCSTVQEMGWSGRKNGELLSLAEGTFDIFLTIDQGLTHQQNLKNRPISVLLVKAPSNKIEDVTPLVPRLLSEIPASQPGQLKRLSR